MLFGQVVGTVVATRKDPGLVQLKLLLVRNLDVNGRPAAGYHVAADAVGAGVGEVVLYATGSGARQTELTENRPVDAVIMAIVDTWDVHGETVFEKFKDEPALVASSGD